MAVLIKVCPAVSGWKNRIEEDREFKDGFFASHTQSPIPPEEREGFKGLDYYPPDPAFRFELELHEDTDKKQRKMVYTRGEEHEFLRWGEFRFKIAGRDQVLQIYKRNPDEQRLFLPFKDATNGKETYVAGRYLDLELDENTEADIKWILDFNKSYNPWCAYSENFTCPLVPPENWLSVQICAGEKD